MKKMSVLLAIIILLFGVTACGTGKESASSGNLTSEVSNNATKTLEENQEEPDSSADEKEEKKEDSSVELPYTIMFPMHRLYVKAPNSYDIEYGATTFIVVEGHTLIGLTSDKFVDASTINEPSEILDAYFDSFKYGADIFGSGDLDRFDIRESREVEIDGRKFWRFEGDLIFKLLSGDEIRYFVVGYTFFWDDTPFQITATVFTEEPEQAEIDKARAYVDEMVKTVRDKR